jgi:poly-gamma-glutamate biosynthesis protein PgsC/CapC
MIIGLLTAFVFLELTGVYPGGIIVPGYLALYLADSPWRVVFTMGLSLLIIGIYRLLSSRMLIFGRRKYIFMILTGVLISNAGLVFLPKLISFPIDYRIIGFMVPGIIANHADTQGIVKTLSAAIIAVIITFLVTQTIGSFL